MIRRFGDHVSTVGPGIHYRIPWPVDQVDKVSIMAVKRMEVGFSFSLNQPAFRKIPAYCLTGDMNIIQVHFTVQYRLSDPARYLFNSRRPKQLLFDCANRIIIQAVAGREVDRLLTTGKRELEQEIKTGLNRAVAELALGVSILSVETKLIEPPDRVINAFKDVITARGEKATIIHHAETYRNEIIPQANAEAGQQMASAQAQANETLARAKGESQRFLDVVREYQRSKGLTRRRLFLDLLEEALPQTRIYVVAQDNNGKPVKLKIFSGVVPTSPRLDDQFQSND